MTRVSEHPSAKRSDQSSTIPKGFFERAILPEYGPRAEFHEKIALEQAPPGAIRALKAAAKEILYDQRQTTRGRVKIHQVSYFALHEKDAPEGRPPIAYGVSGQYMLGSQRHGAFTQAFEPNGRRVFSDIEVS